jgi:hypothetical protein
MNARMLFGVGLLILGIVAFAYQGFSYTVPKKAVGLGPIQINKEEKHTVPLPPILGALALIGGISVLVMDRRDK